MLLAFRYTKEPSTSCFSADLKPTYDLKPNQANSQNGLWEDDAKMMQSFASSLAEIIGLPDYVQLENLATLIIMWSLDNNNWIKTRITRV